jgi:hypothetical protein
MTYHLVKTTQEKFTFRNSWRVTRWVILDENNVDMVQPWPGTKKEALEIAKELGYTINET